MPKTRGSIKPTKTDGPIEPTMDRGDTDAKQKTEVPVLKHPSAWQHSLFGCCNNIRLTCVGLFCPFIIAGLNAEDVGESCVLCGALAITLPDSLGFYSNIVIRGKIRKKFGINGTTVRDCLASVCCPWCAFIQQRQEILTRRALTDALAEV